MELALAVGLGSALGAAHVMQWHSFDRELAEQTKQGRNVLVIGPEDSRQSNFRIGLASCTDLTSAPGVHRAGAVVGLGFDDVAQLGPRVPVVGVSSGLLSFGNHQAVVGAALAASSGLGRTGEARALGSTRFGSLRGVLGAPEPPGVDLDAALAVPLDRATTSVPSCVVQLDPTADALAAIPYLQAAVVAMNGDVAVRPVVRPTFDVVRSFRGRPLRFLDLLLGLLGGIFAALARRLRGSEVAAYRTSGTDRLAHSRIVLLEATSVVGCFLTSGVAGLLVTGLSGRRLAASGSWLFAGAGAWLTTMACLHLLTVVANPLRLAKDR
jgi:hypothetical protein